MSFSVDTLCESPESIDCHRFKYDWKGSLRNILPTGFVAHFMLDRLEKDRDR